MPYGVCHCAIYVKYAIYVIFHFWSIFFNFCVKQDQGCKNMLTFLTPESPNFQSFLVLPGVLNESLADININDIIYHVLKHKCLKHIKEISLFEQSNAKINKKA